MLKLLKYMKKYSASLIVIVLLLFTQAMCDLSLPDYTSDIVNVGIQQGGISSAVPEVMRESSLEEMSLFLSDEDYDYVEKSYLTAKDYKFDNAKGYDKLLKKYPEMASEPTLVLREQGSEEGLVTLGDKLAKAELIIHKLNEGGEDVAAMQEQLMAGMQQLAAQGGAALPADATLIDILKMMPKEQLSKMQEEINKEFATMPESIIAQTAVIYVKSEYAALGADTDSIQNGYIWSAGFKMLAVSLVGAMASIIVGLLSAKIAAGLGMNLRSKVFNKVVGFSNNEFDKFSTASLITRSTNDIQQVQMVMVMMLRIVIYAPIMGIGGVIKVLQNNVSMVWIVAMTVVIVLGIMGTLFLIAMPKFKKVQQLIDKLNLVTREILTGLSVIRAFSTEKHEEGRFDDANKNLTKTNLFVNRIMTVMMPTMMLIMNGVTVLIVWIGAQNIEAGAMQVGNLMAFIQYTMQIVMSFVMISMMSIMLPRASVSANRIVEIIDTKTDIHDPQSSKLFVKSKKGFVEFRDVCFRYPKAEEDVLSHLTFTAKPGQTTAIIGSTGSGKSTLVNLIPRFYDVTSGAILIDGVDVRETTQHDLRDKLGFVPQKGVLFSGTIASNIKYGAPDASEEEMRRAAEIAQATAFIEDSENGFDRDISQGGSNVSGGQKQRLSIARAIAKRPEIFVFDDSFSALDYKTDVALRRALKKETSESTVIIIAQRISTILHAEQIIVLDEGEIAGIGTHKELLNTCEVYNQIATSQLSKEELEHE